MVWIQLLSFGVLGVEGGAIGAGTLVLEEILKRRM
jgi:L-cystine uptake protein TcyP (sodium:dicarboxylate symporter family)